MKVRSYEEILKYLTETDFEGGGDNGLMSCLTNFDGTKIEADILIKSNLIEIYAKHSNLTRDEIKLFMLEQAFRNTIKYNQLDEEEEE